MKPSSKHDIKLVRLAVQLSRYVIFIGLLAVLSIGTLVMYMLKNPGYVWRAQNTTLQTAPVLCINPGAEKALSVVKNSWLPPNENTIPKGRAGMQIRYGRQLIAHTALYFGPHGSIAHLANGLNCQNCHLNAGTVLFANNFASVAATYPKFSPRSGIVAPLSTRIKECFERSMAGKVPDTTGKEVKAMLAYINWVGSGVNKHEKLIGSGAEKLPFMGRAADAAAGRNIYAAKCQNCHGNNGAGLPNANKTAYTYPPLWGNDSYNDGAGMYQIIKLAGFIKNNMPYGATYQKPQLTNQQAWDVAAYVNSQPRPHKNQYHDWPQVARKPVDFPFGPYADNFTEQQHKYGPYKPIQQAQKQTEK